MKLEVLARRIGWMRNGEMAADPALSRLPPSLSTVRLHCRRSATLSHRTSSLHIISHFNVDHYPRILFVLNPLMMQDAQSLSPFEEQQSFSKLKSFDEVSHKLWGRHWRRMPMQQKSKTLQNRPEITLLVSLRWWRDHGYVALVMVMVMAQGYQMLPRVGIELPGQLKVHSIGSWD